MHRILDRFRSALVQPRARLAPLRKPVEVADLLGRPAVDLDTPELQRFLAGKRVLVTGAGGSIGSEICRQTMRFCPQRLLMLERAENSLFEIDRELRHNWVGADIRPCIGDVCDANRVRQVFEAEAPQVVFHCAAHKHVPMMEAHPCEAIKNNIFGTKTVADAAAAAAVTCFVMVSTDKAVNPTSVMGATKRFAELYVQSLNREGSGFGGDGSGFGGEGSGFRVQGSLENPRCLSSLNPKPRTLHPLGFVTRFLAVRFGNVLGSSGSVVPIFQKQIEAGGPLTVTHPEMRRFFMTIPEASQLVMQAGAIGQGGEIFVLDMGAQIRILDLAMELIRRNGLEPHRDIEIQFSGIRPGEKLYEELANDDEQTQPTTHPKLRIWQLPPGDSQQISRGLEWLWAAALSGSAAEARRALSRCIPEYQTEAPDPRSQIGSSDRIPALRLVPADSDTSIEAA